VDTQVPSNRKGLHGLKRNVRKSTGIFSPRRRVKNQESYLLITEMAHGKGLKEMKRLERLKFCPREKWRSTQNTILIMQ